MRTSTFALIFGLLYLVAGLLGLIPAMLVPPPQDAPPTTFAFLYGYLLGLFPANIALSFVHLAVGAWGLSARKDPAHSLLYARSLAVLFGVLAVLGLLPVTNTLFGMMPVYGGDVWLHGVTAVIAAYFGWREPVRAAERRRISNDRRQRMIPVAQERRFGLADRREHWDGMAPA
jgi:hypothetical protein